MILLFFMQTVLSSRYVACYRKKGNENEWEKNENGNFYDLLFIMRRMNFSHRFMGIYEV